MAESRGLPQPGAGTWGLNVLFFRLHILKNVYNKTLEDKEEGLATRPPALNPRVPLTAIGDLLHAQ